jgi:septal ring factor EnvC (AmiA/AmiB activator)
MEPTTIITGVTGLISAAGGAGIFALIQRKLELKHETDDKTSDKFLKRIEDLEEKVEKAHDENVELLKEFSKLHSEIGQLKTEVVFLREERKRLESVVDELTEALKSFSDNKKRTVKRKEPKVEDTTDEKTA